MFTFQRFDSHFTWLFFEVSRHPFVEHCELSLCQYVGQLDVLPRELPLGVDGGSHGAERRGRELGAVVERQGCVGVLHGWSYGLLLLLVVELVFLTTPSLLVSVLIPTYTKSHDYCYYVIEYPL